MEPAPPTPCQPWFTSKNDFLKHLRVSSERSNPSHFNYASIASENAGNCGLQERSCRLATGGARPRVLSNVPIPAHSRFETQIDP
jgi:hypothetical protein